MADLDQWLADAARITHEAPSAVSTARIQQRAEASAEHHCHRSQ